MAGNDVLLPDTPSTDSSEDSWIFLDEVNDNNDSVPPIVNITEATEISDVSDNAMNVNIEMAREASPIQSKTALDAVTDDDENQNRILPKAIVTGPYDDSTDGSTTDGSISLLGDHEFLRDDTDGQTSPVSRSPQPSQLWMRCHQPELILSTRPAHRSFDIERKNMMDIATINDNVTDLGDTADAYLTRLNKKIMQSYLFNVLLLILTGCSFAIFAVLYARYITPIYNVSQLKEIIRNLEVENGELSMELNRCRIGANDGSRSIPISKSDDSKQCEVTRNDIQGQCVEPSEADTDSTATNINIKSEGKIVWTGEGNVPPVTKLLSQKQFKYEDLCNEEIHDDLFSEYIKDYCNEVQRKRKFSKINGNENKPSHYHRPDFQRRTIESTHMVPEILSNEFEFDAQFIDPNKFNLENIYDDYDFGQELIVSDNELRKSSQYSDTKNSVSIEDVLLQMDGHLEKMTQSCYLKYKQLKDDNIFNPAVIYKAQKKLLKLKKKLQKNEKRWRQEDRGETDREKQERNDVQVDRPNKEWRVNDHQSDKKYQRKENRKEPKKINEKESKWNKTAKEYKKSAIKSYDERRF